MNKKQKIEAKKEEILRCWELSVPNKENGVSLCGFIGRSCDYLSDEWYYIWGSRPNIRGRKPPLVSSYFDSPEETYLMRALCLAMLLDDNEELLV